MVKLLGRELWQWDVGRKVEITQPDGYTVNEVHFAKKGDIDALVVLLQDNVAGIPNLLLQDDRPLCVYLVMTDGETEQTLKVATFAVTSKPKPTDYVYTETEVLRYETLQKQIDILEDRSKAQGESVAKLRACNSVDLGSLYNGAEEDPLDGHENVVGALYNQLRNLPIGFKKQVCFYGTFDGGNLDSWNGVLSRSANNYKGVYGIFEGNSADGLAVRMTYYENVHNPEIEYWSGNISKNPEMEAGVEYMTAEKWNGKPVYTMMLDFGALPNAKTKYVRFDQTMSEVISIDGIVIQHHDKGRLFARNIHHLAGIDNCWVRYDGGDNYFAMKTTDDLSAEYTAKVVIKYIK